MKCLLLAALASCAGALVMPACSPASPAAARMAVSTQPAFAIAPRSAEPTMLFGTKPAAKKAVAKKPVAKKVVAKKAVAKKVVAKKVVAKKVVAKKVVAKKAAPKPVAKPTPK